MGISADGIWYGSKHGSAYLRWRDHDSGEIIHEFELCDASRPSLVAIIHEINEGEVNELLRRFGYRNVEIKVSQKMFEIINYKKGHVAVGDEVHVSHMISPYGCCGCCMPRSKHRLRW